MTNFQYLLEHI